MIARLKQSKLSASVREAEIASVQKEAIAQRHEARGLLGAARTTGEALRRSRSRNHYGMILDDLFNGRRSA